MLEAGIPLSEVTFQNTVVGFSGSPEHRYYDESVGEKPHRKAKLFLTPTGVLILQKSIKGLFIKGVSAANVREWMPL